MGTVRAEIDGRTYRITVPEGADPAATVDQFAQEIRAQGSAAPAQTAPTREASPALSDFDDVPALQGDVTENRHDKSFLEGLGDRLGVVGDFARGTVRDITGADVDRESADFLESQQRGVGLGARATAGAIPKTAAGITDLLGMALNVPVEGLDRLGQLLGDQPLDARLPTGNVAGVNELLNEVFPQPETFGERVVDLGGEALVTGGAAGARLAARPETTKAVPGILDEIGAFFRNNPTIAGVSEFGGGAGAQIGGELAADAEADPIVRLLASLGGGLAGAVSPQVGLKTGQVVKDQVLRAVEPVRPGGAEARAARNLQAQTGDPDAAAQRIAEAPDDVTGPRASEDPNLRAIERRVAEDDPQFANTVDERRAAAEQRTIKELTEGLQPGQDPAEWQRGVVAAASPPGTTITGTQPDEMLQESFQSFRQAYAEVDGFPVQTQVVQVEGGSVALPELITSAVSDRRVLARQDVRESVEGFVSALYDDIAERGTPITNRADETVVQFDSSDMLDFRQTIRAEQRRLESAGRNNPEAAAQARLLKNVENGITESLESQVPEGVATTLRELDARYSDFKTVEDAVLRGTPGELTAQNLSQSIKMQAGSRGRVARGDTGDLGQLAEQGRDIVTAIGKKGQQDQMVQRTVRNMTDEQRAGAQSDLIREMQRRSRVQDNTSGEQVLNGNQLLKQIDDNASTLRAAGFKEADINRMRQLAKRLRMIQSPDPRASTRLIDDHVGALMGLLSRVAGARSAQRIVQATQTGGAGQLSIMGFMSKLFDGTVRTLNVSSAEALIRDAMQPTAEGRELLRALLTRSTAKPVEIRQAQRRLNAWAAQTASIDNGEE